MADLTTKLAKFLASLQGREAAILYQASVTLTNDQVKAFPTTGFHAIVAAPGANLLIVPVELTLVASITTNYTNIADFAYLIGAHDSGAQEVTQYCAKDDAATLADITTLLNSGFKFTVLGYGERNNTTGWGVVPFVKSNASAAAFVNTNFGLKCDNAGAGNFTGGNAANTLTAVLTYKVLNVSTGVFV